MSKKSRRKLFVDRMVQGAIIRRLMFHWVVVLVVLTVFLVVMQTFTGDPFKPLSQHVSQIWQKYGLLLTSLACLLPVFAYDSVELSHRFAGPMVNMRRALRKAADGENVDPVKFRKGDYWQPLADDFNRIAAELKERKRSIYPGRGCCQVALFTNGCRVRRLRFAGRIRDVRTTPRPLLSPNPFCL